ncbi:MAG TPA: protein kinase [Pyrinomonadaceae bacterium]|nr:protein kinase [Pyrinomonadaceae bacterium]
MRECSKCELCFDDTVEVCPEDQIATKLTIPGDPLIAKRYRLERRLGRGAMGQVYLAKDTKFESRFVAIKTVRQDILNSEDLQEGEALVRFEREAQAAASIQHPNTVSVTDFGETEEGVFYLVMEYVEGETLHKLLRREGTLPVKRAVNLLKQIADGVEAAHEKGILHRDLKPANIFILQKGRGDGFIKVGDFGLAKIVNQTVTDISSSSTPSSRGIIGTPEFMAPEQMQPETGVDARADLYALGTIAYLMLGGRTPFTGDIMQLVMQKIMQPAPPLSSIRTDIPADVEQVIMRALATSPDDRPKSVSDWITALEEAASDVRETSRLGASRLIIMGPAEAEVYVNDERKGSIGASGRIILTDVPAGRHVLRVSKKGERDDERLIEVREGASEQVIQAQLRPLRTESSQPSSQGSSSSAGQSSQLPGIVACINCGARFAEGARFCGKCGGREFRLISPGSSEERIRLCPRCGAHLSITGRFCGRCGFDFLSNRLPGPITREVGFTAPQNKVIQQAERVCRNCGISYPPKIKFCGRCGSNLI